MFREYSMEISLDFVSLGICFEFKIDFYSMEITCKYTLNQKLQGLK